MKARLTGFIDYKDSYDGYVYVLVRGKEIRYVGQTTNLERRIQTHYRSRKIFTRAMYLKTKHEDRVVLEAALIRTLKPKYNLGGFLPPSGSDFEILRKYNLSHLMESATEDQEITANG